MHKTQAAKQDAAGKAWHGSAGVFTDAAQPTQAAASKGWQAASGIGSIQHSQEALQAAMSRDSHACIDSDSSSAHM